MKKEHYYSEKLGRNISLEGEFIKVSKSRSGYDKTPISEILSERILRDLINFIDMEEDIWVYKDSVCNLRIHVLKTSDMKVVHSGDGYFKLCLNDMIVKYPYFHRLDVGERGSFLDFIKKLLLE